MRLLRKNVQFFWLFPIQPEICVKFVQQLNYHANLLNSPVSAKASLHGCSKMHLYTYIHIWHNS